MSALAKLLLLDGHSVEGVDVKEDFYTSENLRNITIFSFEDFVLDESFFYIIGNAYHNHYVSKIIIDSGVSYDYYPAFINKYFNKLSMIAVSGSHGMFNLKGKRKYGVKSRFFRFSLFYFSLKIG